MVELGGRNAEVKEDAVGAGQGLSGEHTVNLAKVAFHDGYAVPYRGKARVRILNGFVIAVNANQSAGGQPAGNAERMPCTAQGGVNIDAVW